MKKQIVFLIAALLAITSLQAQVKIGDNPQSIHPASVLELQSNNRVLVITRVTDAQMSTINPLRGAMVYNTDAECIHYFNGTEWINICEELDNSFTVSTEAVFNTLPDSRDSTVVVTQTETPDGINYNFEVNRITGDNIYNRTIFGVDLAFGSISEAELQNGAVGLTKLADGASAGQLLQWDGTEWVLISEADITITEIDGVIGNEVTNATTGGSLQRNGGGTDVDPWTLDVVDGGINTDELADNAVTTVKISNGNVTNAKLDKANIPLSGFGAAGANVDLGGNKLINVDDPTLALDAVNLQYLNSAIADSEALDNDTDDTNEVNTRFEVNGANLEIEDSNGTLQVALTDITNGVNTDNQDISTDGNPGNISIDNGSTINLNVDDADASNTNEVNTRFEVNGANLEIEDSNGTLQVALTDIYTDTNTINASLTQDGTDLILTDSDANTVTIPLADIDTDTNTVNVSLTQDGTDLILTDSETNTVTIPLADIDTDTNTVNVSLTQDGTDLILTDSETNTVTIPLADIDTDTNTVNVSLTQDGTDLILTDSETNTVTIPLADIDTDTNTVNVSLTQDGTDLILTDSETNTVTIPLADIDTNTTYSEGVGLTLTGTQFSVTNPVVSMGKVNLDGSAAKMTGATVARNGAGSGNYTVTFDAGVTTDADYIVQLTLLNAGPNATIEVTGAPTTNDFTVQISDTAGAPIDAQWYFTVTDF